MSDLFKRQIEERVRLDAKAVEDGLADLVTSVSALGISLRDVVLDSRSTDVAIRACLAYLHVRPGVVPNGINRMEDRLDWLCRPSGTMYHVVQLDEGWEDRAYGVLLGRLGSGEPIALIPRSLRGYYYFDTQTGRREKLDRRLARQVRGDAIAFYKPMPAKSMGPWDLVKFLRANFDHADCVMAFVSALVATLIGLLPAWANQLAFGIVAQSDDSGLVLPITALLVGAAIARGIFEICRSIYTARIATKLDAATEAATIARMLTLPTSFFKRYTSGDLASRVSSMRNITRAITQSLLGSALTGVFSVIYVCQIGFFAPSLMPWAFLVILIQVVLSAIQVFGSLRYEQASLEESARLSGIVTSLIAGIQKLKLAGAENRALAWWSHRYAAYARVTYNRPLLLRMIPSLITATGLVGTIAFYMVAVQTHISVANYMAFSVSYGQAAVAVIGFTKSVGYLAQIRPNYHMVAPILKAEPEMAEDARGVDGLDGSVIIDNVSFRYEEKQPYVLHHLSLSIRPREYVAIVGKSGCGKSTLVRLLLGFERPEHGSVIYGRHNVQKVDLRSLRQHIGLVMQHGRLFRDDILSNITISTPNATLDDAWRAAELACIADDIRKMPMGMHTMVSEGTGGLSGGQRQRLLIARAVCGGRKVLVFDEATSALDNLTQSRVSEALDKLDCTRIVIAHRLSTVRHCDRILVLDGGQIAEEGTYEELIARGGLFANLVCKERLDGDEWQKGLNPF